MNPASDRVEPSPKVGGLFTTTHWSVVLAAGRSGSPQAAQALETLCGAYWYPLYAHVRRRGHGHEDAQDQLPFGSDPNVLQISRPARPALAPEEKPEHLPCRRVDEADAVHSIDQSGPAPGRGAAEAYLILATLHERRGQMAAALRRSVPAQVRLGSLLSDGISTRPDYVEAWIWFSLAAGQGDRVALFAPELRLDRQPSMMNLKHPR